MSKAHTVGTFRYGLSQCWSTCTHLSVTGPLFKTRNQASILDKFVRDITVSQYDLSIRNIRNSGQCNSYGLCYCIKLPDAIKNVKKVIVLRSDLVRRLHGRYHKHESTAKTTANRPSDHDYFLPGSEENAFLKDLCSLAVRKFATRFDNCARTAPPDLYTLWSLTSRITTELFADALNESGVLQSYCSLDSEDTKFGSLGPWASVEQEIEGAGANPPFDTAFIQTMMEEFDRGTRGRKPYCRCALLPLGKKHGVIEQTESLTGKGILLVRIPSGCLSFKHQEEYFMPNATPKVSGFHDLGLLIWRNRDYLQTYPPPNDVELVYWEWISRSCHHPEKVILDVDAFIMAFPQGMRSKEQVLPLFSPENYDPLPL